VKPDDFSFLLDWLKRHFRVVDETLPWPTLQWGFTVYSFARVREPAPGEFKRTCEDLRHRLPTDRAWDYDFRKAEEVFGWLEPAAVFEYVEPGGDGWSIYVHPNRERLFLLGGQKVESIAFPPKVDAVWSMLREKEARLRDKILAYVKRQPDLAIEDAGGFWPAIRRGPQVLECREASEITRTIVGYHVAFCENALRERPDNEEERAEKELFVKLREAARPQQAIFESPRSPWLQLHFWTDADSDRVFSTIGPLGGRNDAGIVQWSLLPYGSRDAAIASRFAELEREGDRAEEIAYAEKLAHQSSEAADLIRRVRAGQVSCFRCGVVVRDARQVRQREKEIRVYCPDCRRPAFPAVSMPAEVKMKVVEEGVVCPNCRMFSKEVRFLRNESSGRDYLICLSCGCSFPAT
jgi:hypothetical protein